MSMPEGTIYAGGPEVAKPKLTPEAVRVFVAEDSELKREAIIDSLQEFGLGDHVVSVDGYDAAEEFMQRQTPGELDANVFLLDGELDASHPAGMHQGARLANVLLSRYTDPILQKLSGATEKLKEGGLSDRQIAEIIQPEGIRSVAAARLRSEALLVGVSRVHKGGLDYPAQFPFAPYAEVGKVVYESVIPEPIRNKIAKQQKREADRARSLAEQAGSSPAS